MRDSQAGPHMERHGHGSEPVEKNPSKLDYDHYIEKQIKPIADSVLSFQDKSFDELVAKHKQTTLGGF